MLRASYLRKEFVQTCCWLRYNYSFAQTIFHRMCVGDLFFKIRSFILNAVSGRRCGHFFHAKKVTKNAQGLCPWPECRYSFYGSLLPVHSTADVIVLVQSDFHCVKIKLLCVNQSLRRRFSFSFIGRKSPTTHYAFDIPQFFYATHILGKMACAKE